MRNKLIYIQVVLLFFLFLSISTDPVTTIATDEATMGEATQSLSRNDANNVTAAGVEINPPLFRPDHFVRTGTGICYGISEEYGFLFSMDSGNTWEERNSGLPLKLIYPFQTPHSRYLTSLGVDPLNVERVAVTTTTMIYLSEDYGKNWSKINISKPVPGGSYLTSIAISPANKNTLLIGTSYDGIFETKDRGKIWSSVSSNLRFLYKGAYFWEEISALAYHPVTGEFLFACGYPGTSVTPSLYRVTSDRKMAQQVNLLGLGAANSATQLQGSAPAEAGNDGTGGHPVENGGLPVKTGDLPVKTGDLPVKTGDLPVKITQNVVNANPKGVNQVIDNLYFKAAPALADGIENQNSWFLQVGTRDAIWLYPWPESPVTTEKSQSASAIYAALRVENSLFPAGTSAKNERMRRAAGKYGVYIRWDYAIGKRLDEQLNFVKKNGFNSIVVDLKDDDGFLTYNSKLPMVEKAGAIRKNYCVKIEDLIKKARDNGIYVIGRLVIFKDERLYRYQNFKYAIWNRVTKQPWESLNKREFWVDPYSPDVWDYNIAIAEELQTLGIDEIQFDYIRFPTDGDTSQTLYRYRPLDNGMIQAEKKDALESFLTKVRERISVPISTDLYGFNCWCRMDGINGQNVELISKFVDVVCPMFYPSHFPNNFLKDIAYLDRAKVLYQDGATRAYAIVEGRAIIRPYVQAFLMGGETKMTAPSYTKYLLNQLEGVFDSPTPGFTLWNYGMKYFMVTKQVSDYMLEKQR